jgi:hypothetical protein
MVISTSIDCSSFRITSQRFTYCFAPRLTASYQSQYQPAVENAVTRTQAPLGTRRNGQSAHWELSARREMIDGAYTCQPEGCQEKTRAPLISNDSKSRNPEIEL